MNLNAVTRVVLSITWLSMATLKIWTGHGESSWLPAQIFWAATITEFALAVMLWSRWSLFAEAGGAMFYFAAACASITIQPAACGCMGFLAVSWKSNAAVALIMASTCLYLMLGNTRPVRGVTQHAEA